eukprot:765948-Hanusia_phi.AAC.6
MRHRQRGGRWGSRAARGGDGGLEAPRPHLCSDEDDAGHHRERPPEKAPALRYLPPNGRLDPQQRALRDAAEVQQRPVHRRADAHDARWRAGAEPNRSRHGHLRRARLEPHEGPASYGPRAPHRAEEGGQRVSAHHPQHARGEDHGSTAVQALHRQLRHQRG